MPSDPPSNLPTARAKGANDPNASAIEKAIIALNRFWSDSQLYPSGHPVVSGQLAEAEEALVAVVEGCGEVTVKSIDGDLIYAGHRLFARTPAPSALIGAIARRNIGYLSFQRGVTASDLEGLCVVLSLDPQEMGDPDSPGDRLADAHVRHIEVGQLGVLEPAAWGGGGGGGFSGVSLMELYQSAMDVAREALQSVRSDRPVDLEANATVIDQLVARVTEDSSTAIGLACLKGHDEYTFSHCVHTALLTMALGETIGLEAEELHELGMATVLHDVGKVLIPLEVLRKPGKLTDQEWETIKRHPADGAAILLEYPDLPATAPVVAFEHHMCCDMSGYPEVPGKRDLSLFSMMLSLADVYDALTTYRPYRPPMRPEQAAAEMRRTPEGKFEPRLAEWFRQMLGVYPPGTCVELDTGECAVVCRGDPSDELRPTVCVVLDPKGNGVSPPHELQLSGRTVGGTGYRRAIARAIDPSERGVDPMSVLDSWLRRYSAREAAPA